MATFNRLMPFLVGALTTVVLSQILEPSVPKVNTCPQVFAAHANRTDALFEKLWKEREGQVWMSKEEARMVAQYLEPGQTMWEWGRSVP